MHSDFAFSMMPSQAGPILLKLRVDDLQHAGCDVRSLSVFPDECEWVYPPCTYLEPRGEREETIMGPNEEEFTVKIIEVVPQLA